MPINFFLHSHRPAAISALSNLRGGTILPEVPILQNLIKPATQSRLLGVLRLTNLADVAVFRAVLTKALEFAAMLREVRPV